MLSLSLQCVKTAIVLVVALGSATSGNEIVCPDDISQITALDHAGVDWDAVPILGVAHHRHLCNDAAAGDLPLRCSVGDTVVNALEADEQVTVVDIEVGELICSSLQDAYCAKELVFSIDRTGVNVRATRKSISTISGSTFENGEQRYVWRGEVVENADFVGIPRAITMTWSGCNSETYFLEMTTPMQGTGTSVTTTIPCEDEENEKGLCIVQTVRGSVDETDIPYVHNDSGDTQQDAITPKVDMGVRHLKSTLDSQGNAADTATGDATIKENTRIVEFSSNFKTVPRDMEARRRLAAVVEEGIEKAYKEDPDLYNKDQDIRLLVEFLSADPKKQKKFHQQGIRRVSPTEVTMPSGRKLQTDTTVDVLVLYTPRAMSPNDGVQGRSRTATDQMESILAAAYAGANDAMKDSGVDVHLNIVHMELIDYAEGADIIETIYAMYEGTGQASEVPSLRDEWGADLVQLVGFYDDACGIGFTMEESKSAFSRFAYSVVHINCLMNFSHTHEIGHNMGANHDRTHSDSKHNYAYAYRDCAGDNPFRTIMAYHSGCGVAPRVNVFSNPERVFSGRWQGTATEDNARILQDNAVHVANFRESRNLKPQSSTPVATPAPAPKPTPKPISSPSTNTPSSPTSNIPPTSNAERRMQMKWKGCFWDDPTDRVMKARMEMPAIPGETAGLTRDKCMSYCFNKPNSKMIPFKFFGVENGMQCFCGHKKNKYERLGKRKTADCDVPCAGDPTNSCGGASAVEVFKIKSSFLDETRPPASFPLLGCYPETLNNFDMSALPVMDYAYATRDVCNAHCVNANFRYFALQFGYMCMCGNTLPPAGQKVNSNMCQIPCADPNSEGPCGGNWFKSIYAVDESPEADVKEPIFGSSTDKDEQEQQDDNNNDDDDDDGGGGEPRDLGRDFDDGSRDIKQDDDDNDSSDRQGYYESNGQQGGDDDASGDKLGDDGDNDDDNDDSSGEQGDKDDESSDEQGEDDESGNEQGDDDDDGDESGDESGDEQGEDDESGNDDDESSDLEDDE